MFLLFPRWKASLSSPRPPSKTIPAKNIGWQTDSGICRIGMKRAAFPKSAHMRNLKGAAFLVFGHDIEISYGVFLAGKAVVVLF